MRLRDKVAIVTGAAQGIGEAIALRFAEEGAHVVATDVLESAGRAVVAQIQTDGGSAEFVTADVSREGDVQAVVEQAAAHGNGIDVLVNNAGVLRFTPWSDLDADVWRRVLDINLTGLMLITRAVVPHMVRRGSGSIINVSSIHATVTGPAVAAYAASKGGVLVLTRNLAAELGPAGIRANSLLPGYIRTPLMMADAERITNGNVEPFLQECAGRVASRRVGDPADVAGPAVFLASDDSAYVNGAALSVDGGLSIQLAGTA